MKSELEQLREEVKALREELQRLNLQIAMGQRVYVHHTYPMLQYPQPYWPYMTTAGGAVSLSAGAH